MIGNDVIDIAAAKQESNWQRTGYLQKLFSVAEREMISGYNEPEIMVFILWSMKEAAYKIYNRETGIRSFIPFLLECSINAKLFSGIVTIGKYRYYTKTILEDSMIHTIAVKNFNQFCRIAELHEETILKDDNNLPYISTSNFSSMPVSISHHGRFKKIIMLESV